MASITVRIPFVVTRLREGLCEAIPLTSRDVRTVSDTSVDAVRIARKRLSENLKGLAPEVVARYGVTSEVEMRTLMLELTGEKRSHRRPTSGQRAPIVISVSTFGWTCGAGLVYAVAPHYDVQVISTDRQDADNLIARQIRQTLNGQLAEDAKSLAGILARPFGESKVLSLPVEIDVAELSKAKQEEADREKATAALKQVASRWNATHLRRAYHRDDVVKEFIDWIAGTERRSVLLVGRSGVGKTAIVHEAIRQMSETMPSPPKFYATDGSRLIAGQCGFGMLQEQCLQTASEIERLGAVLHLGNLVQLIESGKINGRGGCASLLTPRISSGRLTVIIEATPEEIDLAQRSEPRLMAALEVLHIDEPESEATRLILMDSALNWHLQSTTRRTKKRTPRESESFESPDAVSKISLQANSRPPKIDIEALIAIDQLHRRFPTDSASPGRPLAFLRGLMSELSSKDTLTVEKVNEAYARQTGLPSFLTDPKSRPDLDQIRRSLNADVMGQPHAVEAVVDTIATLATWLSRGDRPLASLLLIGPTGVGKTETAKAIARLIYHDPARMIRIDLSEFSTPDASRRLIGDSYSGDGVLTGAIRAQPFSLVLLDEFEKADRTVFDLLLQVLGEGRLTDSRGRLADFRNSIILMTSNLGVDTYRGTPLGLVDTQGDEARRLEKHFDQQVRSFLRPEMYNRIDRVIAYRSLSPDTIKAIARGRIDQLEQRDGLLSRAGRVVMDDEAMSRLVLTGYEPQYGARPLARTIEREIVTPLAEALCETRSGETIVANVSVEHANLCVKISSDTNADHAALRNSKGRLHVLNLATESRRHYQSLLRSPQWIALQNRETMNRRIVDQQLRSAKNESARGRVINSLLYQSWQRDQLQISAIQEIGKAVVELEQTIALAHHRHEIQAFDFLPIAIEKAEQQLIDCVISLVYDGYRLDQPASLVFTSKELSKFVPTLQAYISLANKKAWTFRAYLLINTKDSRAVPSLEELGLGKREPSFAIESSLPTIEKTDESNLSTKSVSGEMIRYSAIELKAEELPGLISDKVTRLLIEFEGDRAWAYMSTETGLHTCLPANAVHRNQVIAMGCDAFPIFAEKVTLTDDPNVREPQKHYEHRRHHDASKQSVRDYQSNETFHCGPDPQACIEQSLEESFRKRVMELLSDEL